MKRWLLSGLGAVMVLGLVGVIGAFALAGDGADATDLSGDPESSAACEQGHPDCNDTPNPTGGELPLADESDTGKPSNEGPCQEDEPDCGELPLADESNTGEPSNEGPCAEGETDCEYPSVVVVQEASR